MPEYYNGTKVLSLMDINNKKPEIYIVETNRTGGKTTFFGRMVTKRWFRNGEKFMLLYRYKYEMSDIPDKFFKDISSLFFPGCVMTAKMKGRGVFYELYINDKSCGYAVSLNSADQIKKYSHLFSDVGSMLFDEFQSETGNYCTDELKKLLSIHTSVARGQGKQVRYVPVYMLANSVSLLNPYYVEMGISGRLRDDTKFLRGDGFVMERGFIQSASDAQLESGFNRAFGGNIYVKYAAQNVYLNDSKAFVESPSGNSKYLVTLKVDGKLYAIREYAEAGIIYCDDKPDVTYPGKITVTTEDHDVNYVMLRHNDIFLMNMRYFFERGCFRFKNLMCKEAVLKALAY